MPPCVSPIVPAVARRLPERYRVTPMRIRTSKPKPVPPLETAPTNCRRARANPARSHPENAPTNSQEMARPNPAAALTGRILVVAIRDAAQLEPEAAPPTAWPARCAETNPSPGSRRLRRCETNPATHRLQACPSKRLPRHDRARRASCRCYEACPSGGGKGVVSRPRRSGAASGCGYAARGAWQRCARPSWRRPAGRPIRSRRSG